jgi:hypothetical protein
LSEKSVNVEDKRAEAVIRDPRWFVMPLVLKIEETSSKISRRQLQIMSLQLVADVSEQKKTETTERLAKSLFALFPPVRKTHSWLRLRRAGPKHNLRGCGTWAASQYP